MGTNMELWYFDRGQIIVTGLVKWTTVSAFCVCRHAMHELNCVYQDLLSVIRFFLPLLFADLTTLGWDPTVVPTGTPGQFDITVEDADGTQTVYRTLEVISSLAVERDTAKATRIYKAVELKNGTPHGKPVVLKDVWRQEELGREGDTLAAIRECDSSQAARDLIAQRTLTVLHHGDVVLRSPAVAHPYLDYTRTHVDNAQQFAQKLPLCDPRFLRTGEVLESHYGKEDGRRCLLGRMFRYRIVFKEICTTLSHAPFPEVFAAIRDVCEGGDFC